MSLLCVLLMASSAFEADSSDLVPEQLNEPLNNEAAEQPQRFLWLGCPYGWTMIDRRCFIYVSRYTDWASAERHCLSLGANLVSIHSEYEYQRVKALIRSHDYRENPTWLGLSDCGRSHCLSLGANLVSIHSEYEYQSVKTLIRSHDYRENPTWLGLSDCGRRNRWFWSDGTRFDYSKWNRYEPNHLNGECCVHMNWGSEKNWNDIPCHLSYPFVCVRRV
ncbi:hypothetical protein NFI96_029637 [Prochilodus magdalenae]|nr:hypothetical protein NFI96_029637 [Prochilodus magdalenae]